MNIAEMAKCLSEVSSLHTEDIVSFIGYEEYGHDNIGIQCLDGNAKIFGFIDSTIVEFDHKTGQAVTHQRGKRDDT